MIRQRNVLILALCQGLMMTGNSLLIASSALIGLALAPAAVLATLPLALQLFATMFTSVPASLCMARLGRRAGFMLGSGFGILGAAIGAFAIVQHRFTWFCAATVLIGTFNGFAIYYRFAAADAVAPGARGRAISYVLAGGVVAAFVGPNLANWSRDWFSQALFAGSLLALVVVYLLSLALLSALRMPLPRETARHGVSARPLREVIRQPAFMVAVLCGTLAYATMTFIMTATPLAMQQHAHGFAGTALVIQWHVFAMFAPSFLTAALIGRVGLLNLMMLGVALLTLCVVINLAGHSLGHFWLALLALGVGWNFLFVGGTTLLTDTYREPEKAHAQAVNDFTVFTAVALSSLSAGVLHHLLGWQWLNLLAVPALVTMGVALWWLKAHAMTSAQSAAAESSSEF